MISVAAMYGRNAAMSARIARRERKIRTGANGSRALLATANTPAQLGANSTGPDHDTGPNGAAYYRKIPSACRRGVSRPGW